MKPPLRAVIIGAGWAGEGHTKALRYAGAEVVAICARQSVVVQQVADRKGGPGFHRLATDSRNGLS